MDSLPLVVFGKIRKQLILVVLVTPEKSDSPFPRSSAPALCWSPPSLCYCCSPRSPVQLFSITPSVLLPSLSLFLNSPFLPGPRRRVQEGGREGRKRHRGERGGVVRQERKKEDGGCGGRRFRGELEGGRGCRGQNSTGQLVLTSTYPSRAVSENLACDDFMLDVNLLSK